MGQEKDFTVIFEKAKNHTTYAATGAWGGVSPDGLSFAINFFVESRGFPSYIQTKVKDGKLEKDLNKAERIQRGDMIREIQTTVIVPLDAAKNIGEWLIKNYNKTKGKDE